MFVSLSVYLTSAWKFFYLECTGFACHLWYENQQFYYILHLSKYPLLQAVYIYYSLNFYLPYFLRRLSFSDYLSFIAYHFTFLSVFFFHLTCHYFAYLLTVYCKLFLLIFHLYLSDFLYFIVYILINVFKECLQPFLCSIHVRCYFFIILIFLSFVYLFHFFLIY